MGSILCCCYNNDKEKQNCLVRILFSCGPIALLNCFMGKPNNSEDDRIPTKSLSFMDFNDEKRTLLRKNNNEQNLAFDSDGDEISDW